MNSDCPVCRTSGVKPERFVNSNSERYECERCGEFILEFASSELTRVLGEDVEKRGVLSNWIRTKFEECKKEPADDKGGTRRVHLDGNLVNSIIQNHPHPTVQEQADNLIRWIGDNVKIGGQYINIHELAVQAIVGSATKEEFKLISNYLRTREFIEDGTEPLVREKTTLSFLGWERYQQLKRATSESRKAFMAMEYGHPELDNLFKDVLKPAVKQTGFDLFVLPERPKAGLIDNRLRVEIRASRFLIADLTHDNGGAYWEAGYAEGLGKPVIYTCEKKKFEECKTHFDTNHHLTLQWDLDEPQKVAEELKATIRATLPAEAKLTND